MQILRTKHKINIDIGNHCNLSCPDCLRVNGTKRYNKLHNTNLKNHPYLNTINLNPITVENWVPISFLQERISVVDFCGALAEPTLNPHCIELVKYFAPHVDIVSISTNADTKPVGWWKELAKSADNLVVRFYLDSLKPDNSLYRQSNSDKVVENLKSFVSAGGKAILSHVLFKHNQDEINDFKLLAKQLNCNYRMLVAREFAANDLLSSYEVTHNDKTYILEKNSIIPANPAYRIAFNSSNPADYCSLTYERMIRIFSNGLVIPCCHIEGHFLEVYENFFLDENEVKPNLDICSNNNFVKDFVNKIELQGGIKTLSLKYNSISNILNNHFYKTYLPMSWKLNTNEICKNCIIGTRLDIKNYNEYNNPNIFDIPKAG